MPAVRPVDRWFIDEILPHESALLQAALRIERNADAAHDLVRDVYARLYALDDWGAIERPRHYALTMVRNLALERLRRSKLVSVEQLPDTDVFDVADDSPSQFRILAARDMMARVSSAMDDMPERCRSALILRRFENRSAKEAAKALGISISTLEKRLARAIFLLSCVVGPVFADTDMLELFG
jgi:RNA polymerase sigma factor (sigma-70 family)